jgi:hypothetical protein
MSSWVEVDPDTSGDLTTVIALWETDWSDSPHKGAGMEIWLKDSGGEVRRVRKVPEVEMVEIACNFDWSSTTLTYHQDKSHAGWNKITGIADAHAPPIWESGFFLALISGAFLAVAFITIRLRFRQGRKLARQKK